MSTSSPSDWLYCGVTMPSGLILPSEPFCVGAFEFSKKPDPFPGCDEALQESAKAFSESLDLNRSYRVKTFFIEGKAIHEVIKSARLYARETLTLFSHALHPFGPLTLMRSGYLVDLSNQFVHPILPSARERMALMPGMMALVDELSFHPLSTINNLLSTAPERFGELGKAIRRSTHWSDLARRLDGDGERLLFQWMACETLTRTDEKESLTPKLVTMLCIPNNQYWLQLPPVEQAALKAVPEFSDWRKRLIELFEHLRETRNHIVHSGVRELDLAQLLSESELMLIKRVLPMVLGRLQSLALAGLDLRIKSIEELWSRYGECVLRFRQISLAHELEHTILFSLKQSPHESLDE